MGAARTLLTLEEKDHRRLFEGNALLRRLVRIGVLDEGRMKLDYVLGLKIEDFLERRLQTQVFKLGLAKSIHHARVLIRQRHIRVRKQVVNVPSFIVRLDSQKHIDFSLKSPFGGGRPGRVKRGTPRRDPAAETRRTRTKNNSIAVGQYSVVVADFHIGRGRPHQQPLLQCRRTQTSSTISSAAGVGVNADTKIKTTKNCRT